MPALRPNPHALPLRENVACRRYSIHKGQIYLQIHLIGSPLLSQENLQLVLPKRQIIGCFSPGIVSRQYSYRRHPLLHDHSGLP